MFPLLRIGLHEGPEIRRSTGIFPRQIRADDLPTTPTIRCFEQHVRSEIQNVRINRRKNQRSSAVKAIFAGTQNDGRNVLRLPGNAIKTRCFAAIDKIRIQRIGRDIPVLFYSYREPVTKRDPAEVASTRRARAPTFLLPAVHPVRKLIVRDYVIKLRSGLVVPGTPGLAAVDAESSPLVAAEKNNVGVFRVNPNRVIVIAAGSALECTEILPRVRRPVRGGVGDVNDIFVVGCNSHAGKIRTASPDTLLGVYSRPVFARIFGTIEPTQLRRIHQGVHAFGIIRCNSQSNAPQSIRPGGQPPSELTPIVAAVG